MTLWLGGIALVVVIIANVAYYRRRREMTPAEKRADDEQIRWDMSIW